MEIPVAEIVVGVGVGIVVPTMNERDTVVGTGGN